MTNKFNFLIYKAPDKDVKINAVIKDETIWLTQKSMAELFGVQTPAISKHLKNIFEEGELEEQVVISKMETTTQHGAIANKTQTSETNFYNLDAIISVGYRVNSIQATHFRIWATKVLKEYIQKGFVLDDERLKQGKDAFGKDYCSTLTKFEIIYRYTFYNITTFFTSYLIFYNFSYIKKFSCIVRFPYHILIPH